MDKIVKPFGLQQPQHSRMNALLVVHVGAHIFHNFLRAFEQIVLVGFQAFDHIGLKIREPLSLYRGRGRQQGAGFRVFFQKIRVSRKYAIISAGERLRGVSGI